jgi:hypothetical protein
MLLLCQHVLERDINGTNELLPDVFYTILVSFLFGSPFFFLDVFSFFFFFYVLWQGEIGSFKAWPRQ